jgi:hypothetical protein
VSFLFLLSIFFGAAGPATFLLCVFILFVLFFGRAMG